MQGACELDPFLKFRWFPETMALQGFLPLVPRIPARGFRQYLSEEYLPYFSRGQFGTTAAVSWTQGSLLDYLDTPGNAGLILHAPGGAGQSRVGVELGAQSERRGWMVLRVHERAGPDNLAEIFGGLSKRRTILLFDYVESHPRFLELAQTVQSWNEEFGLPVNFFANCRTSCYGAIAAERLSRRSVDLGLGNEKSYRQALAGHILRTRELATGPALDNCEDVPIRAVFLCCLKDTGRTSDLDQILRDASFESWIKTKASASLARLPVQARIRKAAEFLCYLPLGHETARCINGDPDWEPVFSALRQDRWFEEEPADVARAPSYAAPHDVFADTLLLAALELQPGTEEGYLLGILRRAADFGCVASAFTAIQRIAARMTEGTVSWGRLIGDLLCVRPAATGALGPQILSAPFIPPGDKLELLQEYASLREGLDGEPGYQNALGILTQWLASQSEPVQSAYGDTLLRFVRPALRRAYHGNYLIAQCLRWRPEEAREPALRWFELRLALLQTHFRFVAWLECALEPGSVRTYVGQWLVARHLAHFPHSSEGEGLLSRG